MNLVSVYSNEKVSIPYLYKLLGERPSYANISHGKLPAFKDHAKFVRSKPYLAWYLVMEQDMPVGAVYLTKQREVGLFIGKDFRGQGIGRSTMMMLKVKYPGKLLANIAPSNHLSKHFFENVLGFKKVQETYSNA